jgi:1,4-dihydroxy-6-naphthoate synthase
MIKSLTLGFSPCPNDTFIFCALAEGKIDTGPYRFDLCLHDVEELNQKAARGILDISKVSSCAVATLMDDYCLLRAGGAIGRGCGPLIVSRCECNIYDIRHKRIAIPGKLTTAHLLLDLLGIHEGPRVEMPFDHIMDAVADGTVEAGVIIHESRFTYPSLGLRLVLDLGNWWETETGLPLPLGGIVIKRSLGKETAAAVEGLIRQSLIYARKNPEEAWPYIRAHAQEMDPRVMQQHIDMFVNDFSLEVGTEGETAIHHLLGVGCRQLNRPFPKGPIFWNDPS